MNDVVKTGLTYYPWEVGSLSTSLDCPSDDGIDMKIFIEFREARSMPSRC